MNDELKKTLAACHKASESAAKLLIATMPWKDVQEIANEGIIEPITTAIDQPRTIIITPAGYKALEQFAKEFPWSKENEAWAISYLEEEK